MIPFPVQIILFPASENHFGIIGPNDESFLKDFFGYNNLNGEN